MLDLQKATLSKRISAFLFDIILMFIAVVGIGCVFSGVVGYDAAFAEYEAMSNAIIESHGLTQEKIERFNEITNGLYPDYMNYDQETGLYYIVEDANTDNLNEDGKKALSDLKELIDPVNAANLEMQADVALNEQYEKVIVLSISNVVLSIFLAFLVLEFAIPLLLKNGQTIGKKVFGVAVIKVNGVKITPLQLFVRSILAKYTLETMVPAVIIFMILYNVVGIVGTIVLLGIIGIEIYAYVKSGNGSLIHDVVAATVCVDLESQHIFENDDELIAYKEQMAAEGVGKGLYGAESEVNVYSESERSAFVPAPTNDATAETDSTFANESEAYSNVTFGTVTLGDITVDDVSDEEFFKPDEATEEEMPANEEPVAEESADEAVEEATEAENEETEQ